MSKLGTALQPRLSYTNRNVGCSAILSLWPAVEPPLQWSAVALVERERYNITCILRGGTEQASLLLQLLLNICVHGAQHNFAIRWGAPRTSGSGGWVTALAAIPALASSSPLSTMFKTGTDGEDSGGH
ncbi:hypothetical protein OIDMADRAFT_49985 [Oidiodendron maius Zn]|uniref:Uncharacterized protein n=1 Tax=Oidiodendron maius (strain Zn) TaxID=913774 RepID=A0A0C3HE54_OIDMZ|nr:hypothetical protein OIDMADRAFT_49985 [Oidiodendron maius Zn]